MSRKYPAHMPFSAPKIGGYIYAFIVIDKEAGEALLVRFGPRARHRALTALLARLRAEIDDRGHSSARIEIISPAGKSGEQAAALKKARRDARVSGFSISVRENGEDHVAEWRERIENLVAFGSLDPATAEPVRMTLKPKAHEAENAPEVETLTEDGSAPEGDHAYPGAPDPAAAETVSGVVAPDEPDAPAPGPAGREIDENAIGWIVMISALLASVPLILLSAS